MQPTPMKEALRFIDALRGSSGVVQPELGPEWDEFRTLCARKNLIANEIPDAWLAAAVIYQGEHLVSFDRDFQRLLPRGRFTQLAAMERN